jgi:phosphomannomutase
MNETLRVVAFDLDDTLAVSKSRIDQHMADLLGDLLARLDLCIITGGSSSRSRLKCSRICMLRPAGWPICISCPPAARATISGETVPGTGAMQRYVFGSPVITIESCLVDAVRAGRNHTISEYLHAEGLTEDEKRRIVSALTGGAKDLGFWEQNPWGEIIEDRGSQITYSALGQRAPADAKHEWDV